MIRSYVMDGLLSKEWAGWLAKGFYADPRVVILVLG